MKMTVLMAHVEECAGCPLAEPIATLAAASQPGVELCRVQDLLAPGRMVSVAGDRAELERIGDRVLYVAVRDVLPERRLLDRRWQADLLRYVPGVLPSGELHRSIGHWNQSDQVEIFQVLEGEIGMFVSPPDRPVWYCRAVAGDVLALPLGAWHITYAIDSALVFNLYGDALSADPAPKYSSGQPVRHWLRNGPAGPMPQAPADVAAALTWAPAKCADLTGGEHCLGAFLSRGDDAIAKLFEAIRAMPELRDERPRC